MLICLADFCVSVCVCVGVAQTCLLVVSSRVWVGSFDKSIRVINAENGKGELLSKSINYLLFL